MTKKDLLYGLSVLFLLLVNGLYLSAQETIIVKISDDVNLDTSISNSVTLPQFSKALSNYKKNNLQLSADQSRIIKSLNSYRIVKSKPEILDKLNKHSIRYEPNYQFKIEQDNTKPNDPKYPQQWALEYLKAEQVWKTATGKNIIIGVIDTGIEWEHEDLKSTLWVNSKEDINKNGSFEPWDYREEKNGIKGDLNGIDDDGNGTIDDVIGYDFVNQYSENLGDWRYSDPVPYDENGHGTIVSGVIAAGHNNGKGISGLAYDSKIMTLRCFDINGNAYSDNIASSIIYAVINGAKVLNLSFGEKYNSSLMQDAIDFALESGCIVVASAGNEGSSDPHFPSDYEGVISVGYMNKLGKRDNFSNYGHRLTLLAPGVKILTTSFVGDYREVSGSSLAAPYVSATAALLIEKNPALKSNDISGILQESADDMGSAGWDVFTGSGVLNAVSALNYPGITNITINNPKNDTRISRDIQGTKIDFIGSVVTPLFSSFEAYLGKSRNPLEWESLASSDKQVSNDSLFSLYLGNYPDTDYVFRIKVNQRDGNFIERRIRFSVSSSNNYLKFVNARALNVFSGGHRIALLVVETDRESIVTASVKQNKDTIYKTFTDLTTLTKYHVIAIDDPDFKPGNYDVTLKAYGDFSMNYPVFSQLDYTLQESNFSTDKFIKKNYSTGLTYLLNQVSDFNGDGKEEFVANDLQYGIWNGTNIYQFDDNKIKIKDSTKQIYIPVGIGDSNGDGIKEILAKDLGETILLQGKTQQSSPFGSVLFADTTSGRFFAGAMHDFTGDGKEELVCYTDTSVVLMSFVNGSYKIIATALNPPDSRYIGTLPGISCGDFDGDGNQELCFGNPRGHLFIYQFDNNSLTPEFSIPYDYSDGSQNFVKADIDKDGIPELITLNSGTNVLFGRSVNAQSIWSMKVLKSNSPNNYAYIFADYYFPVKQGSTPGGVFYRNGLSAGDIGTGTDAILVSVYPDFYSYVFNTTTRKIQPFWHYPDAFANSAIVHDFDKNGINEIGFSNSQGTTFFEYNANSNPNAVIDLAGWSVSDSYIYLTWGKTQKAISDNPDYFKITVGVFKDDVIELIGTDTSKQLNRTFNGFTVGNTYFFRVEPVSADGKTGAGKDIAVYHHTPLTVIKIEQISQTRFRFKFSGLISETLPLADLFIRVDSEGIHNSSVLTKYDDSTYLVRWPTKLAIGNGNFTIGSLRDYYYTPTQSGSYTFTVAEDDTQDEDIYLKGISLLSFKEFELEFSEDVIQSDAENISNYILAPLGELVSISNTSNPAVFRFRFDDKSPVGPYGINYSITAKDIKSSTLKIMTKGAGNTLSFVFAENELSSPFVYPNPVVLSDKPQVFFARLTPKCLIHIYDETGKELRVLEEKDGNGGVEWDCSDINGIILPTGKYFFKVIDPNGNTSTLKKFAIVR